MEATDEKVTFEIIEKVPKEKLQVPLKLYAESAAMESYVKLPFLLVGALFLIHNVFIAGNSYSYSTYKNIKNIEISIIGIIVLAIFIMAGIAMNKNSKTKKALKEISKRYTIKTETVQEEFSALAIHMYGGRGVVLKK
ncbi:hypothetical protein [Tenacibaculum ovolyticum]|uniref:hypothetical protein n=1 Tax=Tenacibaculum ovolyticum TaxID=104270 RepID=UPI0007EE0FBE|nr:hypothetical protein [Tenacibaculum ovolyticum]